MCRLSILAFGTGRHDVRWLWLGPAEFEELGRVCAPRDGALRASGRALMIGSLATPDRFRAIRAAGDGGTRKEGPYVDVEEPVGAFFNVEASTMDEASELARLHPTTYVSHLMGGRNSHVLSRNLSSYRPAISRRVPGSLLRVFETHGESPAQRHARARCSAGAGRVDRE